MADTAYTPLEGSFELPKNFRKLTAREKRDVLFQVLETEPGTFHNSAPSDALIDLADVMVESAVGMMPVPLGIAGGIQVDGEIYNIPMATEEPSVIAAATYAGSLITRHGGGFHTTSTGQIMTAQIAIEHTAPGSHQKIIAAERDLHRQLMTLLGPMTRRGGGYRGIEVTHHEQSDLLVVYLHVDTRDAMGANIINSAAEALRAPLESITGGTVLMAILTNAAPRRRARATFSIPVNRLGRGQFDGAAMARRIVKGNEFADTDTYRAVTHNKGIMNGVTALALATGNDTRAIESAAHAYAVKDGRYRALTEYVVDGNLLTGSLEMPIALGTVGGAVGFHPVSTLALKILFLAPDIEVSADRLSRIAVSLGLAQNFAALSALVSEGIQQGHMKQHSRRLAWLSGARDSELQELAHRVWDNGTFNMEAARRLLSELRQNG